MGFISIEKAPRCGRLRKLRAVDEQRGRESAELLVHPDVHPLRLSLCGLYPGSHKLLWGYPL